MILTHNVVMVFWEVVVMDACNQLVQRYADGRPICNCGEAYYSPCGHGIDARGAHRTDMLACKYGCSANKISAKAYIASRMLADLGGSK